MQQKMNLSYFSLKPEKNLFHVNEISIVKSCHSDILDVE